MTDVKVGLAVLLVALSILAAEELAGQRQLLRPRLLVFTETRDFPIASATCCWV